MHKKQRSIRREMALGVILFAVVLGLLIAAFSNFYFTRTIYNRYQSWLGDLMYYIDDHIDPEDMRQCVQTGQRSEKLHQLQGLLNGMIDCFSTEYIYIVIPTQTQLINVCSATSKAERDAGETDMPLLDTSDAYPPQVLEKYLAAWNSPGENTFFYEASEWGNFYTGCRAVCADDGETVALICVDLPVEPIQRTIVLYVLGTLGLMVLGSLLIGLAMMHWLKRAVIRPIQALERSARALAEKAHGRTAPENLVFEAPALPFRNELSSLSEAITSMAGDMQVYVETILSTEQRASSAEEAAENVSRLAYQDPLTHVKSKTAYDAKVAELEQEIRAGTADFGLVMVDLNNLKDINDRFGHENGDQYIIGACNIVCTVFKHSPVYRIGGDEFLVLLQGADMQNRQGLMDDLRLRFWESRQDARREPWERCWAAAGMAVYTGAEDTVQAVFARADQAMYQNKQEIKREARLAKEAGR